MGKVFNTRVEVDRLTIELFFDRPLNPEERSQAQAECERALEKAGYYMPDCEWDVLVEIKPDTRVMETYKDDEDEDEDLDFMEHLEEDEELGF